MNLKERSYDQELLDDDNIPATELKRNLAELNFINTYLGGHKISIAGMQALAGNKANLTICEIGCGGGDNIAALSCWCQQQNINATFIGIDIKPVCIEFAKGKYSHPNVTWIVSDYKKVFFPAKPDVIFSSLFCHHFSEQQIVDQLVWMKENCKVGFFINDLQRNSIAYHSIKFLTGLFSQSYLVKHDAPLSVARALTNNEWKKIFRQAQIHNYNISWKWAFRFLIVFEHDQQS